MALCRRPFSTAMLAVLLAGGLGTRLRPLTFTTPKPLLPVGNVALVEHALRGLPPEVDEVLLATGYKTELIEAHFQGRTAKPRVRVVREDRPLGTGGAIRNALAAVGGARGTFLVRNADLVDTLPIADMLRFHRARGGLATISLWEVEDPSPFGVAMLEGPRIVHFVEKPKKEDAPSRLINAGTYILEPEVMDMLPPQPAGELSMERVAFPKVVASPRGMFGFTFTGHWIDCGRPDAYLEAHRLVVRPGATLAPGARCEGQVKGFACLGPGATVERGAVLEDSVLLDGARVARDAVVARSILGKDAVVGAGARVEDSVLGDGASAPPQAQLRSRKVPDPAEVRA